MKKFMMMIAICALASGVAFGQTGQISGIVTDQTGAVLPGVDVTLTQADTGAVRSAVTNETGAYAFPALQPAGFQLEVSLPGFQTFVQTGIVLQVGGNVVIDAALQVGQVAQTIEVVAQNEVAVETRAMAISDVIENERIVELPLAARDVTSLLILAGAGAVDQGFGARGSMDTGIRISVAGNQVFGVQYLLDGAVHNNRFNNANNPLPFPDALQEFRVSTSTQETSQGRAGGAAVNAVTRSGTNQFHGNTFWFVRNEVFNARDADSPTRNGLKRNQFGGTIGGPIVSNKLFFFQGYQNTIERSAPSGNISNVPTAAMIAGDWTAYNANCGPRWDPNGAAYASGTVDPATYSPVALAILSRPEFPSGTGPCGDIRWGVRGQQRRQQSVSRVDWQQSDNLSIFGRYLGEWHDRPTLSSPDNLLTFTGASGGTNAVDSTFHSLTGGGTWIVSADTLMSARFSYASTHMRVNGAPFFNPSDVGINQWTGVDRIFNFSVTGEFAFGAGTLAGRDVPQTSFQWGNDWTLNRGNHQFSIGGVFARDDIRSDANTRSVGSTNVRGDFTGEAIGDFFSGVVTDIRQSGPSLLSTHQDYAGLYIQDIWRATPNLTVNLGLRWEPYFPLVWDILGDDPGRAGVRVFRFDKDAFKAGTKSAVFPTGPAGFTFPAQDPGAVSDFDGSAGTFAQYNQWAPRIGLAWDPTGEGRTSIRASYGITYDVLALGAIISTNNTSPWSADINNRAGGTLANPWANLAGFNTSPFPFNWRETPLWSSGSVFAAFSPDGEIDTSYTQSWNLAVQQQIGNDWRLSVTYLGNQTAKLWMIENANAGIYFPGVADATGQCMAQGWTLDGVSPGATCTTGGNLNARRELTLWAKANGTADQIAAATGQFSALDIFRSPSTASYHSMLTSIRGTVGGVTFNANHTWAKCISDRAVTAIANPGQAPIVPETRDRAVCSSDRRHILNMTVVASTPEFANRGVNAVFSDWRLSTIYRVSSGTPMTIDTGRDDLATGNQARGQFADVLSNNIYLNRSGDLGTRYFNPASFARPAGGVVGNGGQFIARGFSNWSLDAALSRTFNVTESQSFEVRAEAFNITNSVRPNNPENTITSSRFGLVRTVQDARVMQFALKWLF